MIIGAFRAVTSLVRTSIGYLGFTATFFTGIALLLKREFVEAGLLYLTRVIGPFQRIYEFAQQITAFWDSMVVQPIAGFITSILDFTPPILIIEIATLTLFALGPILRSIWTTSAMRAEISRRKARQTRLKGLVEKQAAEIEQLRSTQSELQSALDKKDTNRLKSGLGMLGSAGLAGLSLLSGSAPTIGHQARHLQMSFHAFKSSFSDWKAIEDQIARLRSDIESKSATQQIFERQIEQLENADNRLLKRISGLNKQEADAEIAAYVARRMRFSLMLSRYSLAIVGAVLFSYGVDWFYSPTTNT